MVKMPLIIDKHILTEIKTFILSKKKKNVHLLSKNLDLCKYSQYQYIVE